MSADYIAPDNYAGPWTTRLNPKRHRVAEYTAMELATFTAAGTEGVIFESFGHVAGVEQFCRTRYVADAVGNLHCYDSDGARKIIHPANRVLRVLTGK